jgi:predicted RNase H-like HicB family nuclease
MERLSYFLSLPYRIELIQLSGDDGGGFVAELPEVGAYAISAHGETPDEALGNLEAVKRERFQHYLEKGLDIPRPQAGSNASPGYSTRP